MAATAPDSFAARVVAREAGEHAHVGRSGIRSGVVSSARQIGGAVGVSLFSSLIGEHGFPSWLQAGSGAGDVAARRRRGCLFHCAGANETSATELSLVETGPPVSEGDHSLRGYGCEATQSSGSCCRRRVSRSGEAPKKRA